jgi:hypothetical protein
LPFSALRGYGPGAIVGRVLIAAALIVGLMMMPWHRSSSKSASSSAPIASAATAIPEKSIAVLPFENLSRDPNNAYFAPVFRMKS